MKTRFALLAATTLMLGGCSFLGGSGMGDFFTLSDDSADRPDQKVRLQPIEQTLPMDGLAAGAQMGLAAPMQKVVMTPSQANAKFDTHGWDVAGLALGMSQAEGVEVLTTRGYTHESGSMWRRSEDRVAAEFGPDGLMRALSATLLPTERAARDEALAGCAGAGVTMVGDVCVAGGDEASFKIRLDADEDGWMVVREMRIERPGQF